MSLKLGGHLKIGDVGLRHTVITARALGYQLIQTMLSGTRDYTPYEIDPEDAAEFKKMAYGMELYVHLPYTINPCEPNGRRAAFYRNAIRQHAQVASSLGAKALVLHPGFRKEMPELEALQHLKKFLERTYDESWGMDLLLEGDAGSKNGSAVGSLEFMSLALEDVDHPGLGICIDTCHLYARGIDLWNPKVREEELQPYLRRIRLAHLNSPDPEVTLGSNLDRHNTPFEDRPEWDHAGLFNWLHDRNLPCVLERRSIAVQEKDVAFIRSITGRELTNGPRRGKIEKTPPRSQEPNQCQPTSPSTSSDR